MPDIMEKVTSPLVERAHAMRDLLKRDSRQADDDRRLTDAMAQAMIDADLYKIWIPQGGVSVGTTTLPARFTPRARRSPSRRGGTAGRRRSTGPRRPRRARGRCPAR